MSDYIFLRQKNTCPHCRRRWPFSGTHCNNCGMRLFIRPINFKAYEDDGNIRRYWLWTDKDGWKYRDHIMEDWAKPLGRHVDFEPIELNTKSAEERASEQLQKARDIIKAHKPSGNQFGFGKSKTAIAR